MQPRWGMWKFAETKKAEIFYRGEKEVRKAYYSFPCLCLMMEVGWESFPFCPPFLTLNKVSDN